MPASSSLRNQPSRSAADDNNLLPPTPDATGGAGRGKPASTTAAPPPPQRYTLRIPTRASNNNNSDSRDQPTLKNHSLVIGNSLGSPQPAKRPFPPGSVKGASQFFADPDAEVPLWGLAPASDAPYRATRRPGRLALPQSPLPKAFPRTLECSSGRDLFYEQAKSPLHSDSSPIVISSLCYSGATQAQTAMVAAARSEDLAVTATAQAAAVQAGASRPPARSAAAAVGAHARSSSAGETSVKALFKTYNSSNKQSDSAIHRQTVIAQAKARSARRQQHAFQQTVAGSIAVGGTGTAAP
jgi:hypothetical protein